jgi:hypothetical protein
VKAPAASEPMALRADAQRHQQRAEHLVMPAHAAERIAQRLGQRRNGARE